MIPFILNNKEISTDLPAGLLLLDFVRSHQRLCGTKVGCREGDCGACTVLAGELVEGRLLYRALTSCLLPLGNVQAKHIVTVEGLNREGLNFIQSAFEESNATQCGFCTPGFIVAAAALCLNGGLVYAESAIAAVNGNICRCTGYKSIERAMAIIADKLSERNEQDPIDFAIANKMLPEYFASIKGRLKKYQLPTNGAFKPATEKTTLLGGGTDGYVQQPESLEDSAIDFLLQQSSLKGIRQQGSQCTIGAAVTVTELLESPIFQQYFPQLNKYFKLVSSTQIRNMATIGGNIFNASPIGDLTIFFLALDAQLVISDGIALRELPLRKLYLGYKQLDMAGGELIEKICFELPGPNAGFNFEKVSKRTHLDIASVNSAMRIIKDGDLVTKAFISAGGVGSVPLYLQGASAFLQGKKWSPKLLPELLDLVQTEISPISDVRGTETYKRLLLNQLIKAHFMALFPQGDIKAILHA